MPAQFRGPLSSLSPEIVERFRQQLSARTWTVCRRCFSPSASFLSEGKLAAALPPSTFKALMERAEGLFLEKTYARKRMAQIALLIPLALISIVLIVWVAYRTFSPKEISSSTVQSIAPTSSEPSHSSPSPAPPQREAIRESSAKELVTYLSTLPPLQRKPIIESSYLGRRVRWEGKVLNVREREQEYWIFVERR